MPKMNKKKSGSESNITLFKCQICASVFTSMTELSAHSVSHQDDTVFRCIKCNICFPDLSLLNNHSVRAHRPSMHICPQCDEKFSRGWLLEDHMNIHSGEAPHSCPVCALTFAERKTMRVHNFVSHGNDEENICGDCGSTYKNVGNLRKHMFNQHSKSRLFWCDKCGDEFICTIDREQHLYKIHSAFHADVCTICFLQFSGAEEVKTHQERAHAVKQINCDDKKLGCPDKRSECADSDKHLDVNQREDKKYKCSLCKYSFTHKYKLKRHTLVRHTEHKPFECGQCRKCFASEEILNIHILTHTTIGTLKCSNIDCNRVFSKRGPLIRHQKYHCSGNPNKSGSSEANVDELKQYPCLYCKERFVTFSEAQTHIKSHGELKLQPVQMKSEINMTNGDFNRSRTDTGDNLTPSDTEIHLYSCLRCRQCFSTDSDFYAHMKTHIVEPMDCFESVSEKNFMDCIKEPKQFPFLQCNKWYSTSSDLETHKKEHTDSESMNSFDGNVHVIQDDENSTDCDDDTKLWPCLACHTCFTSISDLEAHLKTHIHVNSKDSCVVNSKLECLLRRGGGALVNSPGYSSSF